MSPVRRTGTEDPESLWETKGCPKRSRGESAGWKVGRSSDEKKARKDGEKEVKEEEENKSDKNNEKYCGGWCEVA